MSGQEVDIRIKATDDTKAGTDSAVTNIKKVDTATKELSTSQEKSSIDAKGVAVGLSAVATSAFALYRGYDNLIDSQLTVDRAFLMAKQAANAVEDAQTRYTAAVAKFGAESPAATAALADLNIAKERAALADERATQVQENLRESYVSFGLSVIPSVITMVAGMSTAITALGGATKITSAVTSAFTAVQKALNLAMAANPIGLVITVLAILIGVLIAAYETCEPFRNAVDALGAALYNTFKPAIDAVTWAVSNLGAVWDAVLVGMRWVWDNTIGPILDALGWVWSTLTGAWSSLTGGATAGASEPAMEPEPALTAAHGFEGLVTKPTTMLVGEAGAEYVSISPHTALAGGIGGGRGRGININAPLVYIQGSADAKTAKLAADMVLDKLRRY